MQWPDISKIHFEAEAWPGQAHLVPFLWSLADSLWQVWDSILVLKLSCLDLASCKGMVRIEH